MKRKFEQLKKLQKKVQEVSREFDQLVDSKYGFSYSETDDHRIIDTLDYATDNLSYEEFKRLMGKYKENLSEDGEFGIVR